MTAMSMSVFTVSKTSITMTPGTEKASKLRDLSTHLWDNTKQHWAYVLDNNTWYLWCPAEGRWSTSDGLDEGPFVSLASLFEWCPYP